MATIAMTWSPKRRTSVWRGAVAIVLHVTVFAAVSVTLQADEAQVGPEEREARSAQLFVRRVSPILRDACWSCHGENPAGIEGGLDLRSSNGIAVGGDSGLSAVTGRDAFQSPLYLAATRTHDDWSPMPPKEAERLTKQQLQWLFEWIETGAVWPDEETITSINQQFANEWSREDGVQVVTSGGLSADWTHRRYDPEGLWAYQPIQKSEVARQLENARVDPSSIVDSLLLNAMPHGLEVAIRATRPALIRRATFDLTGLPPTPAEVDAFVNDPSSDRDAFAAVVERLLASPHYGERMAQHWLDVTRYADSSGFANDFERGNAWRYRDYVVRAFNEDKPFDQFLVEQVAGDELRPNDPEALIATGFLRMGPWELTGMEVAKVARQRFLDDVTNSVGETFLGHSLQCARCHDHKFDPIPTRDYYGIQAVFAMTQLAERSADFLPDENCRGFEEREYLELRRQHYASELDALGRVMMRNAEEWFAREGVSPDVWNATVQQLRDDGSTRLFSDARREMAQAGVPENQYPPKLVGFTPQQFGRERVARKGLQRLAWELDRYRPYALAVFNGRTPNVSSVVRPVRIPDETEANESLEVTHILMGGDPFSPGEVVGPGVLSVLNGHVQGPVAKGRDGRRLAFAQWMAHPRNPLTPRVFVNRVWLWHFGRGLAENPNNFGATGKRPTHPELLDWLAASFVNDGWSTKKLHRVMMMSDAYCRSCRHTDPKRLDQLDAEGNSYAVFRPRRLSAEELRDAMLAVSGELNATVGGIPCRPEINREVALQPRMVMGTFAAAWTPNPLPEQRHRRTLYVLRLRGLLAPMLEVMNAPAPDFSCELREDSTVTPQVFAMFNSQRVHARALALAVNVLDEVDHDHDALVQCFRRVFGRAPNRHELTQCLQHWENVEASLSDTPGKWRKPPFEVERNAVEENTGETFQFTERLYANEDFVPDLQPASVSKHERALADVCLVLLNCNEFVYVY